MLTSSTLHAHMLLAPARTVASLATHGTENRVSPDPVTDVRIYDGVMFVTDMAMLFCPCTAKGRGGTTQV